MKIIVTHEQADFDAVASVLGAWLLDESWVPLLPKRMNRNVFSFLNDFKNDLPFQTVDKVRDETIQAVLMVDTQTMNNLPGMTTETEISVIDHHQPRLNLDENWKCVFDHTGACTTILVERICASGRSIDPIFAVLLLMGIYEDTGNLSYGSTIARDLQAAAWLLERGADLNLITRYLNQPLSASQQILSERLLQNCEKLRLMGQEVVIATADARDISDEFSTVAHYLRDMLSPDAIFILVGTHSGVRVISRATNDRIDVGQIMSRFSGGGHSRAAAGLVLIEKDGDLMVRMQQIREELLAMLPNFITPPLTVEQIMSTRPLLLDNRMDLREVSELMKRYGYEGYPVVDADKKVVGLLNRRSVERALDFGITPQIDMIMEAGDYSVTIGDSVEYLKELMNISNWGQIPVINPEDGQVIGIVTRTDVIKTLTGRSSIPGNRNYAQMLNQTLPPGYLRLIRMVADAAASCRYPVYVVGGFVRDLILGHPVMDFDIVVEGDAIHLARTLISMFGGGVRMHARFGTAKWLIQDIRERIFQDIDLSADRRLPDTLDLISARTEFYDYPSAMPEVERSSIKLDLHRRDFTINTMALRLDGQYYGDLLDFWGGYADLHQKLIRVLHSLSFTDDPTRMLRAIRFEQRFGFTLEKHTMQLLKDTRPLLKQVSGRRILNDLELFFHEENPQTGLARLEALDLLRQIHPAMRWNSQSAANLKALLEREAPDYWLEALPNVAEMVKEEGKFLVWWGFCELEVVAEIGKRLQLSRHFINALEAMFELQKHLPNLRENWPSDLTFYLERIPLEALYCFDSVTDDPLLNDRIRKFLICWRHVKPVTTGTVLRALPYPAGDWISALLQRLRKAWIDEEIDSAEDEEKLLTNILPLFTKDLR